MNFKIIIYKNNKHENKFLFGENYYSIKLKSKISDSIYIYNNSIAFNININTNEYITIMKERFNGIEYESTILFKTEEDAQAAYDWIESIMLINKLIS